MLVTTKGGHVRVGDEFKLDGSPAHLRRAVEGSLKRLGLDAIGLYQFHRPDPTVPYADSIGALAELLDEGKIRMAGVSNAHVGQPFLPWMPLGGIGKAGALGTLFGAFSEVAQAHGVSPQRVALAWILAHGDKVIPIPGASRPESIVGSARAADLTLTPRSWPGSIRPPSPGHTGKISAPPLR